jgi:signal transduction histidine kinase
VGERRFAADRPIVLPPRTARLEIEYNALDLTAPHRTAFRYRLDGFDAEWVNAGSRRQAIYTNLPPRTYRFRVMASHDDGVWREGAVPLELSIQPAFYQSAWTYAAAAGLLGLGMWLAWRLRIRHVRREFALLLGERARLGREIHDTLLQSLVGVALQIDEIEHDGSASREATTGQLTRLRKQVENYIREARQSIFNLRSPAVGDAELVALLQNTAAAAVPAGAMHVQFTHSGTPLTCAPRISQELLRIGREAITNAVRHSGASDLLVHLEYTRHGVELRVADNGRGFEWDGYGGGANHYGLTGMSERAREIGGTFEVVSERDVGTLVQVSVPIR